MRQIKVLVVDDSPFVCRLLTSWLESSPEIQVVGTAQNGEQAIQQAHELSPDVITLDLEMPGLRGLDALEALLSEHRVPVIVISGVSHRSAALTLEALEIGAVDFILKHTPGVPTDPEKLRAEIIAKVIVAAQAHPHLVTRAELSAALRGTRPSSQSLPLELAVARRRFNSGCNFHQTPPQGVVVIGASTGGPVALRQLMNELPINFPSVVLIIQHLPPTFTKVLAEQLNSQVEMKIKEAEDGEELKIGTALVAPGCCHLRFDSDTSVRLDPGPELKGCRPSIDLAMQSAAEVWRNRARGVLLTGMGRDGALGLSEIRGRGGRTFAQDAESCTINGMPQSAIEMGVVDHVASPEQIAQMLMNGL